MEELLAEKARSEERYEGCLEVLRDLEKQIQDEVLSGNDNGDLAADLTEKANMVHSQLRGIRDKLDTLAEEIEKLTERMAEAEDAGK